MQRSLEEIATDFTDFRRVTAKDGELLYSAMCKIILDSNNMLEFADLVSLGQPVPNIVFAAIHYTLLKNNHYNEKLGVYYQTIQGGKTVREIDTELETIMLTFIEDNKVELLELFSTRRTQTNEVGRCSFVIPGLNYILSKVNQPVVLLELGTSAGLLLGYDLYSYKYKNEISSEVYSLSPVIDKALVTLECVVKGDIMPPVHEMPKTEKRIGIDLNPIICNKDEEALWLLSLVWPSHIKRYTQLKNALNTCKFHKGHIEMIKGDAFRDIIAYLEQYTDDSDEIVIYHSFAINQISRDARLKYYQDLHQFSSIQGRRIFELTNRWDPDDGISIILNEITGSEIITTDLAKVHHHGQWIQWLVQD